MKFSIYYPITPYFVNQKFGEVVNLQYYIDNNIPIVGHNGTDLSATYGQKVYAAHDGMAYQQVDEREGHGVVIITADQYEYKSGQAFMKSVYWHLINSIPISKTGQKVKAGDVIGYADSTGLSTGNHLHFAIKPMRYAYSGDYSNIEQSNGYLGAIDPSPYWNGLFASDIRPVARLFLVDMEKGNSGPEVERLQQFLREKRYFKYYKNTGLYSDFTQQSVFAFQFDHVLNLSLYERLFIRGSKVGPKTREAINKILNANG